MSEHDFEAVRGLPGVLPAGERILWQGSPDWLALAREAFHLGAVGAYFALMLAWRVGAAILAGGDPVKAAGEALTVAPIALAALGILAFMAWLASRTTVYTITDRRVVLRFGAAIPKAFNIPFQIIESAALKPVFGETGDLALTLKAPNKIAFLHLWPHARPWRVARPEPSLRAVPAAAGVARILAQAIAEAAPIEIAQPVETVRAKRRPRRAGTGAVTA